MSTNRRILLSRLVFPFLAALVVRPAQGQTAPAPDVRLGGLAVEGYYTRYRLETRGDDRLSMGGGGGRVMWRPGPDSDVPAPVRRLSAGMFAEYAPEQDRGFTMLHAGLTSDVNLAPRPLFGRLDPMLSIGAGVLQTSVRNSSLARLSQFSLAEQKTAAFALSPAFAIRVALWRELGVRADVRDLVAFHHGTLHNPQISGGLSFVF